MRRSTASLDFLEPKHFFEPIHQRIYELAGGLIRANKTATPVTLKTFLPGDADIAGSSVNQYLARLAAEATTIINAEDYGRTVYDLSVRRDLIAIGEDMVNLCLRCPSRVPPRCSTSKTLSGDSTKSPKPAATTGFPAFRAGVDDGGRHGRARLPARRPPVRSGDRLDRSRQQDGRLAALGPDHSCRPPGHGQNRARHQHRL